MLSGSTSCSSIAKGNVWLSFHEGTREGNEMKHPLSGLHLEARCSIELGDPHLFTINTSRVNVVFWVFWYFFSHRKTAQEKQSYCPKPKDNIKPFLDRSYLITYRLSDKLLFCTQHHASLPDSTAGWRLKLKIIFLCSISL